MTLDTKALEAAARIFARISGASLFGSEWEEHDKWVDTTWEKYLDDAKQIVSAYNTTRSESLPDELKAIAERAEIDKLRQWLIDGELGFLVQAMADRAALLSFIPDVVRACANLVLTLPLPYGNSQEYFASNILSLLDQPIKSEQQIREEERERCAKELDEAAEIDLQAAEQKEGPETKRRLYAVSRRLRGIATAIRNGKTEG